MKTLERGFGVSIAWCYERLNSGDYTIVHTRTSHMAADIYTKPFEDVSVWTRLRRLINVYSPKEIADGLLSPDPSSYPERDTVGVVINPADVNPHYTYILSGESELNTNYRKPAKLKPKP